MRTHPDEKTRVSHRSPHKAAAPRKVLGCYYKGQPTAGQPDHYLELSDCMALKKEGKGEFINRGQAFRRYDTNRPNDQQRYASSSRRGESLKIDEPPPLQGTGIMTRFVEGERYAVAAVNAWR